jgi:hypothetical protein
MRAIAPSGVRSREARVRFEVLAPLWQRPWFVAFALLSVAAAGVAVHKVRVARALALERVRTQIATDLHDDAGANLAQIAILAEVARQGAPAGDASMLTDVAELARATRSSIATSSGRSTRGATRCSTSSESARVATNSRIRRAPRLGAAVEELAAIELDRRRAPPALPAAGGAEQRSRHAGARAVGSLERVPGRLRSGCTTTGRASLPERPRRARPGEHAAARARAGAAFSLESSPGHGTSLALDVPLARRPRILVRWRRAGRRGRIEG